MASVPDYGSLDITDFTVGGMLRAGIAIRKAVRGATTLEGSAGAIVRYLHEHCLDGEGGRCCALVRFYKTHPLGQLPADLREFALAQLGDHPASDALRCLTLMASAGDEPAWNSRQASRGHRAIPLPSAERVRAAPMIMRLIEDLGIDVESVVAGNAPSSRETEPRTYDVFHVEDAVGSPWIPAQRDFVIPYRVASVIGFGGLLRTGELFAVVLFSRARVPDSSAARFRAIALDIRSSLFSFDEQSTWEP